MGRKLNKKTEQNTWSGSPFIQNMKVLAKSRYAPFLGIILLSVTIFAIVKAGTAASELYRLNWVSARLDYMQSQIERDKTNDHKVMLTHECFYNQQTDFTKGTLNCGVTLTLHVENKGGDTVARTADLLSSLNTSRGLGPYAGLASQNHGAFNVPEMDLTCGYSTVNNPGATPNTIDSVDAVVICHTEASWQYYPIAK